MDKNQDIERDYGNGTLYAETIIFSEPFDFSEISKIIDGLIERGTIYGD